jgi:hypothetical protein
VGTVSTVVGVFAPAELTVHGAPIALLIPPDLPPPVPGRALPTPVLARPAEPVPAEPAAADLARSSRIRVDARGQIAISSGCRDVLMIEPGSRVVLAAPPARGVLLVVPIRVAASWIRPHVAGIRVIIDG